MESDAIAKSCRAFHIPIRAGGSASLASPARPGTNIYAPPVGVIHGFSGAATVIGPFGPTMLMLPAVLDSPTNRSFPGAGLSELFIQCCVRNSNWAFTEL